MRLILLFPDIQVLQAQNNDTIYLFKCNLDINLFEMQ
jgi:hypothetical protein